MSDRRPARSGSVLAVVAVLAIVALLGLFGPAGAPAPQAPGPESAPGDRRPTLYCEFTNFADQTPRVGFYFRIAGAPPAPTYLLVFRREQDGSQTDFDGQDTAAPWRFAGSRDSARLTAPDDETAINLYGHDPDRRGAGWFEAGLRSIPYKNLGGRCRNGG